MRRALLLLGIPGLALVFGLLAFTGCEDIAGSGSDNKGSGSGSGSGYTYYPPPENVVAVVQSASSILVSWDAVPGAPGYRVYRGTNQSGLAGTSTDTSYTDTGLSEDTTYSYSVAINTNYSSDRSYSNSVRTPVDTRRKGVYAGIISFAGAATDLTGGLVRLDQAGRRTLVSSLDSSYSISSQAGTALFYAVHKALASLKSGDDRYPDDLDSVNVITFTDGLDNASTGMSALTPLEGQTFDTDTDYTTYLGGEIAGRTIAGKPVTAYSVGVRGSDVSDTTKFNSDLAGIAGAGKSQTLTNFEDLQTAFQGIADGLQITSTSSTSFTMKTTLLATNIRVRMTFDVTDMTGEAAAASAKYIEGVITRTGAGESLAYSFGGISYTGGLGSVEGAGPISGVRNNNEVSFTFTGVQGYNPSTDGSKVKQWTRASDEAPWQVNSEYSVAGATETEVEALSSVIYLVLDSSTSLNTMQIGQIRSAAEAFINSLYSQLNGLVPSGVSAVAQSSSSVKVSWNPVSGGVYDAESYSIYRSTSSDGPYVYSYSTASPSWLDTGRSSGMTYYYKVSANFRQWLNGGGYNYWSGAQSSCASVTTP